MGGHIKTINPYPTVAEIERHRNVFITRLIARFVQKHRKYVKLLREHGMSLPEAFSTCSVNFCASFEDEVDMIVSEKRQKIRHICKIKGVYSVSGLFRQIYQIVRRTRASRIESKLLDIPNQEISESLNDIANELAIAYEYQITMLKSEHEVRQLADHAISCTMNYLKQSDASFTRCSIIEAITDVMPKKSFSRAESVSTRLLKMDVVKGTREQKWRLSEIFKQPGLRLPNADGSGFDFYGCFTPYGSLCRPEKYGFRGPLHVWDDKSSTYKLLYNDQVSCSSQHRKEIERDTDDVHQNYQPSMLCVHFEYPDSVNNMEGWQEAFMDKLQEAESQLQLVTGVDQKTDLEHVVLRHKDDHDGKYVQSCDSGIACQERDSVSNIVSFTNIGKENVSMATASDTSDYTSVLSDLTLTESNMYMENLNNSKSPEVSLQYSGGSDNFPATTSINHVSD